MLRPVDIATRHSVEFIHNHVRPNSAILEIGCGEGDVAQQLQSLGHNVTAIDADSAAVARAQKKSVNALEARWPDYQTDHMNAIVFTRSLHHMDDLTGAIAAARLCLREGGVLLIEDFAFDEADEQTSAWFAAQLRSKSVASLLSTSRDSFAGKILRADTPHDAWHSDHGHDLHSINAMAAAVASAFETHITCPTRYLFRYLIPVLPETAPAARIVEEFAVDEDQMIRSGDIVPIGRRIIAIPKKWSRLDEY